MSTEKPSHAGRVRLMYPILILLVAVVLLFWQKYFLRPTTDDSPTGANQSAAHQNANMERTAATERTVATINGSRFQTPESTIRPQVNEWPSELFANRAAEILEKIKDSVERTTDLDSGTIEKIQSCFAPDLELHFATAPETPIFASKSLFVHRISNDTPLEVASGRSAVTEFLSLLLPRSDNPNRHLKLKVISVDMSGDTPSTMVRSEASWDSGTRAKQFIAEWKLEWQSDATQLAIRAITVESMETAARTGSAWFSDQTVSIIGSTEAYRSQLAFGLQYWLSRIESAHGMHYFSKHGLSVADVNGDGRDDVYVSQPGGLPNRLFIQEEDGTASDRAREFEIDFLDRTTSSLFVDLDNDGDQDLALATLVGILILENVDQQRFQLRQTVELADTDLHGLSAVDYDNDGYLDLYQLVDYASGISRSRQGLPNFVYHNANDGGSNRLLKNRRGKIGEEQTAVAGTSASFEWFEDVTDQVGLDVNNQRHSLAAAWEDYDNDGDQDLYVANDYGANCFYRNDGERFTEIATLVGVTDFGSGMSVSWGDYDRDGVVDLYVGNMFSSAGNRITTQEQFLTDVSRARRSLYRRFAKGNTLFRNLGKDRFEEVPGPANAAMGRWSWSSLFADINNDGWQDLLVANGYITTPDTGDL